MARKLLRMCNITGLTVENTSFSSLVGTISTIYEEEVMWEMVRSNSGREIYFRQT